MRNLDKVEMLISFFDAITGKDEMKNTLMELKSVRDENRNYVETIRQIKNVDHWRMELETIIDDKDKALDQRKSDLYMKGKMLDEKWATMTASMREEKEKINKEKEVMSNRESAVTVLEEERNKLKSDMLRVVEKEKKADALMTEYECKLKKLKELS